MGLRASVDPGATGATVTSVTGTANQVTASLTTGAVVLTIPSTFVAPGTITATGAIKLGNAYVATPQVTTGYVTIQDSTGTTYKVCVAT
jgi:hypothetical protein